MNKTEYDRYVADCFLRNIRPLSYTAWLNLFPLDQTDY